MPSASKWKSCPSFPFLDETRRVGGLMEKVVFLGEKMGRGTKEEGENEILAEAKIDSMDNK